MLASMLTTMVGFLGLTLATHPGLNSIGKLALIGLFTCFLAAVVVLPALLEFLGKHHNRREPVAFDEEPLQAAE